MAAPLFLMVAGTLFRAASKKLFNEVIKSGAKKATKNQIAKGGAKTLNSNNVGVIKTTLRPKSGGGAASTKTVPKTAPKTSPTQKPSGASSTKPTTKKPASTTTTKPATKKSPAAKKQSALGTGPQRAIIGAASLATLIPNNKKTTTKKTEVDRGLQNALKKRGEGAGSGTFGEAFKKARAKGVGTEFTFKGKKFSAVRDSDIPETIKGNKQERLRKFLTQRKRKAK